MKINFTALSPCNTHSIIHVFFTLLLNLFFLISCTHVLLMICIRNLPMRLRQTQDSNQYSFLVLVFFLKKLGNLYITAFYWKWTVLFSQTLTLQRASVGHPCRVDFGRLPSERPCGEDWTNLSPLWDTPSSGLSTWMASETFSHLSLHSSLLFKWIFLGPLITFYKS